MKWNNTLAIGIATLMFAIMVILLDSLNIKYFDAITPRYVISFAVALFFISLLLILLWKRNTQISAGIGYMTVLLAAGIYTIGKLFEKDHLSDTDIVGIVGASIVYFSSSIFLYWIYKQHNKKNNEAGKQK